MFRGSLKRPFSNATNTLDRFPVYEPPVKQRTVIVGDDVDVAGCEAGTNKIKVYIRVRPENDKELRSRRVIEVIDDQSLLFDPMTDDDGYTYHGRKYKEIGKKVSKDLSFQFDSVFDEKTTNLQVYERAVKGFVPSLLDGFNCTIFAYGPTGSGKTFTMLGYDGDPGVIYYTAMELFHNIETRPSDEQYEVCVSYFEIYNEKVYDLLTPSDLSLKVVDNMGGGVNILGITVRSVNHADELIEQLETGNQYRAQQATDANATSSRSHAVFQLSLRKKKCSKGKQIITQEAKMCLVDLAGSERASVAYKENRSKTLHREGGNINKSLLALGNCINALASKCRKGGKVYIPYRSSVLTRILSDSLGGNCRTAMIATVSPSSLSYDDTHNTLTYANRTKGINLALKRRSMIIGIQPRHQALAIETLQQENTRQAERIILLENEIAKFHRMPMNPISTEMSSLDILNSYQNVSDKLFNERLELRKQLLEVQSEMKKIELKHIFRKLETERLASRKNSDKNSDHSGLTSVTYLYHQKLHYEDKKNEILAKVIENEQRLKELEDKIRTVTSSNDYLVNVFFREKHMEAELQDKIISDKHHIATSTEIMSQLENWLETLDESMKLNHLFFAMLSGLNKLTKEREDEYYNLLKKFEGKKTVVWKDDYRQKPSVLPTQDLENTMRLDTYVSVPRTPIRRSEDEGLEIICSGLTPTLSSLSHNATFSVASS